MFPYTKSWPHLSEMISNNMEPVGDQDKQACFKHHYKMSYNRLSLG